MAKTSAIERNKKRQRMAAQYAAKRARLKAMAKDESLPQDRTWLKSSNSHIQDR